MRNIFPLNQAKQKKFRQLIPCLLVALRLFASDYAFAQTGLQTDSLEICQVKTSSLIFPYPVASVDRGSQDILVQKNKGNDHILMLKARIAHFGCTNLTVVTSDGKCYSFLVNYTEDPKKLVTCINTDSLKPPPAFLHQSTESDKLKLQLRSIYYDQGMLWFYVEIQNRSFIDFKPDVIQFYLEDRQKANRTAKQEIRVLPQFRMTVPVYNGQTKRVCCFAFNQFTVPRGKRLMIEFGEKQGGRLLHLSVSHRVLMRARASNRPTPSNHIF